jgi:tRNA(Ile)-lysidine synthase
MLELTISNPLFDRFCQEMERLGPFETNPILGVALSGGNDSLALTFLLQKWVKQKGGNLYAFHVNHNLRPESSKEALQVKKWMEAQNIPCQILRWNHSSTLTTSLQEAARKARYTLLEKACYDHNILHLITAHHAEDQQETYLIRKQSHSTEYGLAGMSAVTYFTHCRLIRPLLSFTKIELKGLVGSHPYLEDPSNQNPKFHRAKLRQQNHDKVDLSLYQQNRRREEKNAAYFLAMNVQIAPQGYGQMPREAIKETDSITFKRALSFLIRCIGNLEYLPSSSSIEKLYQKWHQEDFSPTSLGKCVVYGRQKKVWVVPDRRLLPKVKKLQPDEKLWGRFLIQGHLPSHTHIEPLGPHGWAQIHTHIKTSLPYHVVITFPTYWQGQKVLFVPFLQASSSTLDYPSFLYQPKNSLLAEFFV